MRNIAFAKLVAAGNDFVLVDNRGKKLEKIIGDFSGFATGVCQRKHSLGADGLLVLEKSKIEDITMRIFNPDGSEVTMCGNGSRCIAYYACKKGITKNKLSIETKAGTLKAMVKGNSVKIQMTEPKSLRSKFSLKLKDRNLEVGFVNTGVPHVIHFVDDLDKVDVKKLGREIRYHEEFTPEGTNANFVKINDKHAISIRTYERGVEDETLACGTGSAASSILSSERFLIESPVKVKTKGDEILTIYFKRKDSGYKDVFLKGCVKLICEGRINYV